MMLSTAAGSGEESIVSAVTDNGEYGGIATMGGATVALGGATPTGKVVGTGWNVKHVFSGGDGVILAVWTTAT